MTLGIRDASVRTGLLAIGLVVVGAGAGEPSETRWLDPVDGLWTDPAMWSDGVPGPGVRAVVDVEGAPFEIDTVFGDLSFGGLLVDSPDASIGFGVRCDVGVEGLAEVRRGSVRFQGYGGPIGQGMVGGTWLIDVDASLTVQDATIEVVTILGDVSTSADIWLSSEAHIGGTLRGGGGVEFFMPDGGEWLIEFDIDGAHTLRPNTPHNFQDLPTLVIAPGSLVRFNGGGGMREWSSGDSPPHFVNHGTLWFSGVDGANNRISIRTATFTNHGFTVLDHGIWADLGGPLMNSGVILVNQSELSIRGRTTADLGTIDNRGSVRISGLDNTGDEWVLDDPAGDWELAGEILGGRLVIGPGMRVTAECEFTDIEVQYAPDAFLAEHNDFTIGDGAVMVGEPLDFRGRLTLFGEHTIPGIVGGASADTVRLGGPYEIACDIELNADDAFILIDGWPASLAAGSTISGRDVILYGVGQFTNRGTILAGPGDEVWIQANNGVMTNQGLIDVETDGRVTLHSPTLVNPGLIRVAEGGRFHWGHNEVVPIPFGDVLRIENNGYVSVYAAVELAGSTLPLSAGEWAFRTITGGGEVGVGAGAMLQSWQSAQLDVALQIDGRLDVRSNHVVRVEGDVVLGPTSETTMQIEDAGPTPYFALLDTGGDLVFGGVLVIDLSWFESDQSPFGSVQIFRADGAISGSFERVEVIGPVGVRAEFDPQTGVVTVLPGCSAADFAEPLGQIDLADIVAFVVALQNADPAADLDGNGLLDLADITAFVAAFLAGCP